MLPVVLDPSHPFPQVANKSLNFIVRLSGHDAFGRNNEIAIVKVPRSLPRLIRLPEKLFGKKMLFVSISSVIRAHLKDLLFKVEAVLEEHELFDVEPWLFHLQDRIAEYDRRIARFA